MTLCLILSIILAGIDNQKSAMGQIADFTDSRHGKTVIESNYAGALPWHLERINAVNSWQVTKGGTNILVAVLDTGIDQNHEDLAGKVIDGVNFSASQTTNDLNGHGTLISGVISASIENLKGATGIAYNSSLLNVKVAGDNGFVDPEAVARGIVWAVDHGAKVINLSLTLGKPSATVEEAVKYAWSKGSIIVAAAGNTASTKPVYPAAYPNVIAVAATDKNDLMTRWSSRGDWVSVSAPGAEIYSTLPGNKYTYKSGTSFATPLVSGEAALLFTVAIDRNGNGVTNDEVKDAILNNTEARTDGRNAGRINVLKALDELLSVAN
jgi:thermitase